DIVVHDFFIFCKLAVQHAVIWSGQKVGLEEWSWVEFLRRAPALLHEVFQLRDAEENYHFEDIRFGMTGPVTTPSGSRSLFFTAEIVYHEGPSGRPGLMGTGSHTAGGKSPLREMRKLYHPLERSHRLPALWRWGSGGGEAFADVGGQGPWLELYATLAYIRNGAPPTRPVLRDGSRIPPRPASFSNRTEEYLWALNMLQSHVATTITTVSVSKEGITAPVGPIVSQGPKSVSHGDHPATLAVISDARELFGAELIERIGKDRFIHTVVSQIRHAVARAIGAVTSNGNDEAARLQGLTPRDRDPLLDSPLLAELDEVYEAHLRRLSLVDDVFKVRVETAMHLLATREGGPEGNENAMYACLKTAATEVLLAHLALTGVKRPMTSVPEPGQDQRPPAMLQWLMLETSHSIGVEHSKGQMAMLVGLLHIGYPLLVAEGMGNNEIASTLKKVYSVMDSMGEVPKNRKNKKAWAEKGTAMMMHGVEEVLKVSGVGPGRAPDVCRAIFSALAKSMGVDGR
ncbi:hypothetical protein FOA52_012237, partial [Chlamydomonas sp. UWO 241]